MNTDWIGELECLGRRIRRARRVEKAGRLVFAVVVGLGLLFAGLRLFSVAPPLWTAPFLLVTVPVVALAAVWSERFGRRECAILIDRRFDLEERLSSSLEAEGPMAEALSRDAGRVWRGVDAASVVPRPLRRAGWLAAAVGFLLVIPVVPVPGARESKEIAPELAAKVREVVRQLEKADDPRLNSLAPEIARVESPEALAPLLEMIRAREEELLKMETNAGEGDVGAKEAAASAGKMLSDALVKAGVLPDGGEGAPPPAAVAGLEKTSDAIRAGIHGGAKGKEIPGSLQLSPGTNVVVGEIAVRALSRHDWHSGYDSIVAAYFNPR